MPRGAKRVQRYSGPTDLLERLSRDLQALQLAPSPAAALDRAITYCTMAWSLTGWLYASVYRDAQVRSQLMRLADPGLATLDSEVFAGLMAELCPDLALCSDISSDPSAAGVVSTGLGWVLVLFEDGEHQPIELQRLEGVLVFWRQFIRKYLADAPAFGLGSRYAAGNGRSNGLSTSAIFGRERHQESRRGAVL